MVSVGKKLEMNAELAEKLGKGKSCCYAAHEDGSENRINGDAVMEAASYHTSLGVLAALMMWGRKKFRNRGKTADDLSAEKEAARINNTCGALEEMLLEYIRSARDGMIDEEGLDELIDTLEEVQGYHRDGKLVIPDREGLAEIRKSIADYTAAIADSGSAQSARIAGTAGDDEFGRIREQLAAQREWIRNAHRSGRNPLQ